LDTSAEQPIVDVFYSLPAENVDACEAALVIQKIAHRAAEIVHARDEAAYFDPKD